MPNEFKEGLKVDDEKLAPLYEVNDIEAEDIYEHYIKSQQKQFKAYIDFMNAELCVLKHYGIVSDYTRFLARIKGFDSAINNDGQKPLNDVFGLEVDTATEGEAAFVSEIFNSTLNRTRELVYNKENGYRAHHFSGYAKMGNIAKKVDKLFDMTFDSEEILTEYKNNLSIRDKEKLNDKSYEDLQEYINSSYKALEEYIQLIKRTVKGDKLKAMKSEMRKIEQEYQKSQKIGKDKDDGNQPIIECQVKTILVAILANLGSANHGDYKGEDISEVQQEYDKEGRLPRNKLPYRMYKSALTTDENGIPNQFKLLSKEKMAKALYPSLILKSREEKEI